MECPTDFPALMFWVGLVLGAALAISFVLAIRLMKF